MAKLNALGIIIDISQLTPDGVLQTLELSKAPVVASHSDVRALVDNTRNLSDKELDAIKANGGVIQVTAFNTYLLPPPPGYREKVGALRAQFGLAPDFPHTAIGFIEGSETLSTERHQAFIRGLSGIYPNVTRELVRRGYDEAQIAKIWGGNFLRVFAEVEAVSRKLKKP